MFEQLSDRALLSPSPHELAQIFMLGYDTWAEGSSVESYLDSCHESKKYGLGAWYVLLLNGRIVSALIVYNDGFNLPSGSMGIGSVATLPEHRRKGFATELVRRVTVKLESVGARSLYLFADIDASFYGKMGFVTVSSSDHKGLMVRHRDSFDDRSSTVIHYF